jgi:hypothetical protein
MDPLEVNTVELLNLGVRVGQLGDAVTRTVAEALPRLAPAGAKGSPWALLAQADATATGWSQYLTGLARRVKEAGQSLMDTADMYQAADERAADRHGPR